MRRGRVKTFDDVVDACGCCLDEKTYTLVIISRPMDHDSTTNHTCVTHMSKKSGETATKAGGTVM